MTAPRFRTLTCALAFVATALLFTATASAGPDPGDDARDTPESPMGIAPLSLDPSFEPEGVSQHYRRYRYKRRYYRTRVQYHGHRTVVVVPDTPPQRVIVTDPPIRKQRRKGYSLALRTVGITYGDTQLSSGTLEGSDVAGFGVGLRVDLDRHWTMELAADLAGGGDENTRIAVTPLSASLLARLFPASRFDLYGLAGLSVTHTAIDNQFASDEQFIQLGAHVGAGAEIKFGHLLVTGDVRYLFLEPRPDPVRLQSSDTAEQGLTEDRPSVVREEVQDDSNNGLQVMMGIGYRW